MKCCIFSRYPVTRNGCVLQPVNYNRDANVVSSHLRIGQRVWRVGSRRSSYVDALRSSRITGGTSACRKDAVEVAAVRAFG